jgi:hypothetical protein
MEIVGRCCVSTWISQVAEAPGAPGVFNLAKYAIVILIDFQIFVEYPVENQEF